jgi:hypothetical protein
MCDDTISRDVLTVRHVVEGSDTTGRVSYKTDVGIWDVEEERGQVVWDVQQASLLSEYLVQHHKVTPTQVFESL